MTPKLFPLRVSFTFLLLFLVLSCGLAQQRTKDILIGSKLTPGFDMGVESSEHQRSWLAREPEYMKMSFPPYQEWAVVFITVGKPVDLPRTNSMDFSSYKTLAIDMMGEKGGEVVEIGLKSNIQPDDGTETKITMKLIPKWKTYTFPLAEFSGTDLKHVYVATEFVYNGKSPQVVFFRNIKLLTN